ncbi:hypothetical protein TRFO_12097 [Tritrichomonas foetus]|uniref:Uncharacterized protein n=1 Tax=Tritrichomonas foetus TaxID=1144522 RepID=A0A1J4J5Z9_9EUKA|nr:hypothetical protein TRFO_12097 [Tritrichomonas foetus]|eukprot:OHS93075.1 hypothetical protein TRFO_12097 [Tritrichomonas foetus]
MEYSDSECNFIFDSSAEEDQNDVNYQEQEDETMKLYQLLNQKVLSPYSNMQSDREIITPENEDKETEPMIENTEIRKENVNTINIPQQTTTHKKKKKAQKGCVPKHLLVTKNEKTKANEEKEKEQQKEKKKIKKSKKEIKAMIDRLMQPPKQVTEEEQPKAKVQTDPKIFDRLYQMSQEKEQRNEKLRKEFEDEEMNFAARKAEKSNKKSNALAEQQLVTFIESIFPNPEEKNEMTETELTEIFQKLGILDNKEVIYKNQAMKSVYEEWLIEKDNGKIYYNSFTVKDALMKSTTQKNYSKFDVYARQRMTIALSEAKQRSKHVVIEQPKEEKKIKKETIIRLSQTREQPPPKKHILPKQQPKRPKPIKIEEPIGMSAKTHEILESCDLGRATFEERDKIIAKKRSEKIEKLDKELHTEKLDVGPSFGQKPQWPSEIQEKLDEYRQKKLNKQPEGPTFRPSIISFEKYQKQIRKKMMKEANLPEGYEESISRHRQAYNKILQKKMEEAQKDPFYDLTNVPL